MSNETAAPKHTPDADSATQRHRPGVAFNDAEIALVRAAAQREHLPVATYIRSVVLKAAEASR